MKELLSAIRPKEYDGIYSYKGVDYDNLIQISEYPRKILLIKDARNIKEGEVVIVKECEEFVLANLNKMFAIDGIPRFKNTKVRVSIVKFVKKAKEFRGRIAVEAMTYKLGEILDDDSVVCEISHRWRKRGSDKTMENIYGEFRRARN